MKDDAKYLFVCQKNMLHRNRSAALAYAKYETGNVNVSRQIQVR